MTTMTLVGGIIQARWRLVVEIFAGMEFKNGKCSMLLALATRLVSTFLYNLTFKFRPRTS